MQDPPLETTEKVATEEDIFHVMETVTRIRITEELRYYIVDLISATREAENILLGASVRASLALMNISRALAIFEGREFVSPEDIQEAAPFVLSHRIQLIPQAKHSGVTALSVINKLLQKIPIPK